MSAIQQMLLATMINTSVSLPSILIASADAQSYLDRPSNAEVSLDLNTNGTLLLSYSAVGDEINPLEPVSNQYTWLVGGRSNLFSVRMRTLSGTSFSTAFSSSSNTWLPVTSNLSWNIRSSSNAIRTFSIKDVSAVLEIAYTNNLTNIIAQSDIYFSTSASTQDNLNPQL